MTPDKNSRPAKPSEHGEVRKHDAPGVTEQPTKSPGGAFFNEDGNKEKDVEHVGARAPDSDPAEEPE